MALKQIKTSGTGGEISQYMAGREDQVGYHNGYSKLVNASVLTHGGVVKRSGTEYIALAPNKARLIPFEFSVDDTLMLEFSNLLLRFYKDGDRVMNTAVDVDGVTLPSGSEVSISTDGVHSMSTGDTVRFDSLGGTTELNFNGNHTTEFVITVVDTDDFTLDGTDGDDFTAWTADGTVASIVEIATVYTSAQAFNVHVTQSADVMYLAHPDHPPQKLSRLSDTSWTIADVVFSAGPFLDENTIAADLLGFARTGGTARSGFYFPAGATGTLTATGGHTPFLGTANDVGTLWLVTHTRPDNVLKTADNDENTTPTGAGIRIKGDYTFTCGTFAATETVILWRKKGNGDWQEHREFLAATSFSATEDDDDVFYTFTRDEDGDAETTVSKLTAKDQVNRGVVKVTAASSTTVATVIVVDPVLSDNATDGAVTTSMWAEGAWGLFRGYPRTVTFFEDRLWWASSTNNPDTIWGSRSGLYEDMSFTDLGLDNEAITAPFNDNAVSQLQWMVPRQVMAVGAANKEYRFGSSDIDKPTTPSDRKSTPQTSYGSENIQPVILNNAIFFFQRQGRKLRAMLFNAITENFDARNTNRLANTILESPPTTMAVQRVPDSIIWITRTDGVLLSFTFEPDEEVEGWARHITQNTVGTETPVGFFESVAIIHGSTEDEVWVSVRRVINSSTVRYIEKFGMRLFDQLDEALMLDAAKTVSSSFAAQDIILASDTVRCGEGLCNSSLCGGVPA